MIMNKCACSNLVDSLENSTKYNLGGNRWSSALMKNRGAFQWNVEGLCLENVGENEEAN